MSIVSTGLILSAITVFLLSMLFRYEGERGVRIAERIRTHFDFLVLKAFHTMHAGIRFLGRDFIRQVLHYIFHTLLMGILRIVERLEKSLHTIMRTNKTLARTAKRENETRNKLEEIALHKVASALSEEEKKEHRDNMLSGT